MARLGFIGLGVMGRHMARHLAIHQLTVFDVEPAKAAAIEGAVPAPDITSVGQAADVVLLSLPSSQIVRDVVVGEGGLMASMRSGGTIIDCSTTEPSVSREIAATLAGQGIDFMDAPVSGGERAAQDGTLAIMVGGHVDVFGRCLPILDLIAASVVRVGDVGAGGVAKLVNNMIVGSAFAVIAESFALGKANGLDPATLYAAIKGGWAGSKVLDVAAPGIIDRDFTPGGSIDVLFKDIGYALSLARSGNVPVPMTAMVDEVFKAARASGRGPYAQQIIIELWEQLLALE
jgi:2-hydroxy-3-oxopropionate reductase